jgi:hypothetical protein
MKVSALILALFAVMPAALHAQNSGVNGADFRGHFIGENIANFLSLEPEAQQEVDVCRQNPSRHTCGQLLGALDRGGRAEISTSASANFVLDGGRLVKITMLVDDNLEHAAASLTETLGDPLKDATVTSQSATGRKWLNHQYVWNTPTEHVTLFQDNNPSLADHRLLLIAESRAEHLLDETVQEKQPRSVADAAGSAKQNTFPQAY